MKILLTGATGLIGKEIGKKLVAKGHELIVITRDSKKARAKLPFPCELIEANLERDIIHDKSLGDVEAVIHLLGESVMGRWDEAKKNKIYDSRINSTKNLVASLPAKTKTLISGSAMGYYGSRGDDILHEDATPGEDFLSKVCYDWETAAQVAACRVVCIRTAMVLAREGALGLMKLPFRLGMGGRLGDGNFWMSWIHLEDISNLFIFALENEKVVGVLNGAAPFPVQNKMFTEIFAKSLNKSMGPPVPKTALNMLFGEMSSVILGSQRASANKVEGLGFKFQYGELRSALEQISHYWSQGTDSLENEVFVEAPREKVFEFFSSPRNLMQLTPKKFALKVEDSPKNSSGQEDELKLSLSVNGFPIRWKTKIVESEAPARFVDKQVVGPFGLWEHTHEFVEVNWTKEGLPHSGTLVRDMVVYKLPLGFLGWAVGHRFAESDLKNLFAFRSERLIEIDRSHLF